VRKGLTTRVTVDLGGGNPDGFANNPRISANGRFVAFDSLASDLVVGDGNGLRDVFVRDLRTKTTVRASVDLEGGDPDNSSFAPVLNASGRYVAFVSYASDLVPGDGNGETDVFVRDLDAGVTLRVSVDVAGGDANGFSHSASISADGRAVTFASIASDLVSDDGNLCFAEGFYSCSDVFVRDVATGTTVRASVDAGGDDGNEDSRDPAISADGRWLAFVSEASDLVPGDGNGRPDVFVRDLVAETTVRASVDVGGGDPDNESRRPVISRHGRVVAFESFATDLVAGDGNLTVDIYATRLR
jgi:Tol biopolymer transport system component